MGSGTWVVDGQVYLSSIYLCCGAIVKTTPWGGITVYGSTTIYGPVTFTSVYDNSAGAGEDLSGYFGNGDPNSNWAGTHLGLQGAYIEHPYQQNWGDLEFRYAYTGIGIDGLTGYPISINSLTLNSVSQGVNLWDNGTINIDSVNYCNVGSVFWEAYPGRVLIGSLNNTCGGGSDDHGNTIGTATTIGMNGSVAGNIETGGDEDYFQVYVGSAGTLTVHTTGGTDTYGYLLDGNGNELTWDDESGDGSNFQISYPVSAGTYYIRVIHSDATGGTGSYMFNTQFTPASSGTLAFLSASHSVGEGAGYVRIYARRTLAFNGTATLYYQTYDSSATAGSDYTTRAGNVTWTDGDTEDKYLDVPIIDDGIYDVNEAFTVGVTGLSGGANWGSPVSTTVTIQDNEAAPPQELVAHWPMEEGSGNQIANATGADHRGTLTNGASWAAGKLGNWAVAFNGGGSQVIVPHLPALSLNHMTIAFWLKKDSEPADWARLVGKGNMYDRNYGVWDVAGADKRVMFQFKRTSGSYLSMYSVAPLEVGQWYHVACTFDGTFARIYVNGVSSPPVSFPGTPVTTSDPLTLGSPIDFHTAPVGALDDVRIYNYALSAEQVAALATPPTVTVAATDATAGEPGTGQGSGIFTYTRTGYTAGALTVNFTVSGTASSGSDYPALATSVTFAPGATATNQTVSVSDDTVIESGQTVVVTLAGGNGYTVGSPGTATVTIRDDEDSDGDGMLDSWEQQYFGTLTREGSGDYDTDGLLDLQEFLRGTNPSISDTDGDGLPDGWEVEEGLNPNNAADADADPDGDGFSNDLEYLLGQDPNVADPRPTITMAATDPSASEPANPGVFTLTRSTGLSRSLSVGSTVLGTARVGRDYQALSGEVVFGTNQATATVTIQPVDDSSYDGTNSVTLMLTPGLLYVTGTPDSATVALTDDEKQPVGVAATRETAHESGTPTGEFVFFRRGNLDQPLTLFFSLTGSAINGTDYQTLPASLTFASGESQTNLVVTARTNSVCQSNRLAVLTLQNHSAYTIEANRAAANIVIEEDDPPVVTVAAIDADAREVGSNPGVFRVTRTGPTTNALTVFYWFGGTAALTNRVVTLGSTNEIVAPGVTDYTVGAPAHETYVVIPVNAAYAEVVVTPVNDTESEFAETIKLTLLSAEEYEIGTTNTATVLLDDNEPAQFTRTILKASASIGSRAVLEFTRTGSVLGPTNFSYYLCVIGHICPPTPQDPVTGVSVTGLHPPLTFPSGVSRTELYLEPQLGSPHTGATLYLNGLPGLATYVKFMTPGETVALGVGTREAVEAGGNATFSLTRKGGGPALTIEVRASGRASPNTDHNLSPAQTFIVPASSGAATTYFTLVPANDSAVEGWESVVLSLNPLNGSYVTDGPAQMFFVRDNQIATQRIPDGDFDGDSLLDYWEWTHGLNPLVPDDVTSDTDQDGLSLLEEAAYNTSPTNAFSLNSSKNDYRATRTLATNDTAAIRLRFGDISGSLSERYRLWVGPQSLTMPDNGGMIEDTVHFQRGTSNVVILQRVSSIEEPPDPDYWLFIEPAAETAGQPAFFLRDPGGLLGEHWNDPTFLTNSAIVIIPKLELTWTNAADNFAIEDNTVPGTNTLMAGGGQRVYVGAKTQTETSPRNTVRLRIKSIPPLAGSNVWLRTFDVDDATDDSTFDTASVIDPNGRAGEDNFSDYLNTPKAGVFVANGQSSYSTTLNASGEAVVELRAGMQPGNNYRVAATVFPTNNLASLQTVSEAAPYFVSPYTNTIQGGFNGDLSPLLTVWRKLHLEVDSMTAPPTNGPQANFWTGTVWKAKANMPKAGQTTVISYLANWSKQPSELENGRLVIPALAQTNKILSSVAISPGIIGSDYRHEFIVEGSVPSTATNQSFVVRDDDDQYLQQLGLFPAGQTSPLPRDQLSGMTISNMNRAFTYAYVHLIDANAVGLNPRPRIPFLVQAGVGLLDGNGGVFDDAKDIYDSQRFWVQTLAFGYQPGSSSDRDPDGAEGLTKGTTVKQKGIYAGGVSVVYLESIREASQNIPAYINAGRFDDARSEYNRWLLGTAAHEVAHAPGSQSESGDHAEQELMTTDGAPFSGHPESDFSPITIRRLRQASGWTQ